MTSQTVLTLLAILVGSSILWAAASAQDDIGYETGTLALPMGDPEAGRLIFTLYRCHACHRVSGSEGMTPPVSAHPGPELGVFQANQNACQLVNSLISPSHIISEEAIADSDGQLSPMGDFTEIMTVRQLIDLVAYVKSLDEVE